jgi:hypothetical protein
MVPRSGRPDRVQLSGLQSERFRHPFDQRATEQLRRLPGLEWAVRRFMGLIEEAVYLDNIANAVLVGFEGRLSDSRILRRDVATVVMMADGISGSLRSASLETGRP